MYNKLLLKIGAFVALLLAAIGYRAKVKSDGIKEGREDVSNEINETLIKNIKEAKDIETNITAVDDANIHHIADSSEWMRKD